MGSSQDASKLLPDLAPLGDADQGRRWSICEDPTTGALTLRLSGQMDGRTVVEAIDGLAERLRRRGFPSTVIADLLEVDGFDVDVPVAAALVGASVAALIDHVDVIARRPMIRIAAVSAATLLGLSCSVRPQRDS